MTRKPKFSSIGTRSESGIGRVAVVDLEPQRAAFLARPEPQRNGPLVGQHLR